MNEFVFTGTEQALRRKRVTVGRHRTWEILPRIGTSPDAPFFDRWTVIGTPIPGDGNPAGEIEDGQFPTIAAARAALAECERLDDGTHQPV